VGLSSIEVPLQNISLLRVSELIRSMEPLNGTKVRKHSPEESEGGRRLLIQPEKDRSRKIL
jgi:hypothetical protein